MNESLQQRIFDGVVTSDDLRGHARLELEEHPVMEANPDGTFEVCTCGVCQIEVPMLNIAAQKIDDLSTDNMRLLAAARAGLGQLEISMPEDKESQLIIVQLQDAIEKCEKRQASEEKGWFLA